MKVANHDRVRTGVRGFHQRLAVLMTIVLGLGTAATAKATLVFDDISNVEKQTAGATATTTSSTPNTFMGDGYTLTLGTKDITGFDIYPTNVSGTTYTGLLSTIYVWGTVNTGAVSAAAPAFSNLLATYTLTSTGTYSSGFYYAFEGASPGVTPGISLNTPLALTGTTIGITLAFQGTTDGVNYASANSLTSLITTGTNPTVGAEVFNGYYRNANSETNGNFTSATRSLGLTNQGLALRVYGDVTPAPEPGTWVLIGLAGATMLAWRKRTALGGPGGVPR